MGAVDALLAKADLTEAFREPEGRAALGRMAEAMRDEAGPDQAERLGSTGDVVAAWERWNSVAETFYVDPRMRDVVTAAAPSMPGEDLLAEDLPSPYGFVLIPGGVGQVNPYGRLIVINAVLWASRGPDIDLLMLTDKHDLRDDYNAEAAADGFVNPGPRYMPSSLVTVTLGAELPRTQTFASTLPPHVRAEQREEDDGQIRIHLLREDGSPALEDDVPDLDFGWHPDPVCQWVVAMWRLMQQSLAVVEPEEPTRQLRRQLQRRNIEERTYSVITLRRLNRPGTGEREVEWTHRWIRRGHWRQQPYKQDGDWVRRAIWIHPTICGPEDKPLLVRDRVYALRR